MPTDRAPELEKKVDKCVEEIKPILEKYDLAFDTYFVLKKGSVESFIELVPRPKEEVKEEEKVIEPEIVTK